MKVLVLAGGDSAEREVSIRSGKAISAALYQAGFEVLNFDPADGDEGLKKAVGSADVVFPILHGVNGEDGKIQKKLEELNAVYLGSDSKVSENCFFKDKTHEILQSNRVLMPEYQMVEESDIDNLLFSKPFVLKPFDGGSSIDTIIARNVSKKNLENAKLLLEKHKKMILEELIEGQEITTPILGDQALPVIAIVPPVDGEFDYENKYNGKSQEICPAPIELISERDQKRARELSLEVHKLLEAKHLSRVDMILTTEGELYVLELNTIPGMTEQSLYPNSAKVAGYNMVDLVKELVKLTAKDRDHQ